MHTKVVMLSDHLVFSISDFEYLTCCYHDLSLIVQRKMMKCDHVANLCQRSVNKIRDSRVFLYQSILF